MYSVLLECWDADTTARPTFSELAPRFAVLARVKDTLDGGYIKAGRSVKVAKKAKAQATSAGVGTNASGYLFADGDGPAQPTDEYTAFDAVTSSSKQNPVYDGDEAGAAHGGYILPSSQTQTNAMYSTTTASADSSTVAGFVRTASKKAEMDTEIKVAEVVTANGDEEFGFGM